MNPSSAPLYYVPWTPEEPDWTDQAGITGADWLMEQPGLKLVLVSQLQNYRQHRMAQRVRGAVVAKRTTLSGWDHGPVLAPWPTREIVGDLAGDLRGRATAICVIPWGPDPLLTAWLRVRRAVSVIDGSVHPQADEPLLEPVVEAAMTELGQLVNHANALVGGIDKAFAVHTLLKLHEAGYRWTVDELCGWALGHGFTGSEEERLRQYATKARRIPVPTAATRPVLPRCRSAMAGSGALAALSEVWRGTVSRHDAEDQQGTYGLAAAHRLARAEPRAASRLPRAPRHTDPTEAGRLGADGP
ncbi:hypothetical protein ACIF9R_37695 [Streptomyces sp. NPDC086080]|uniref:hypothetical protein n=1 Tax=Streptomyces sp. NPDC086080 TaxID=3365748 RepID=UPI0037D235C7